MSRIQGYIKGDGARADFTDWHGKKLGEAVKKKCWKTPRSHLSTTMCQYEVVVDGVRYTGRSAGDMMSFSGKRVKGRR